MVIVPGMLAIAQAIALPFSQTAEMQDLAIIGLLVLLEGVLSIDNALVLGLLAKKLPKHLQKRALTYGLVGALVFRIVAIAMATLLMKWWVVKLLGGGYLVYVAVRHMLFPDTEAHEQQLGADGQVIVADAGDGRAHKMNRAHARQFWSAVIAIELTDIAFAVDSILAAIALVADTHKTWVVILGGFLGVILMRFAAVIFIKLLDKFPRFEMAAYLLVLVIGGKLLVDWGFNKPPMPRPETWHPPVNFHAVGSMPFVIFWTLMLLCFAVGFLPKKKGTPATQAQT